VDNTTWSDHADIRPTMLSLTGLHDDYTHDGRVLTEDLKTGAVSDREDTTASYTELAQIYKQLNACVGQFAYSTLRASTKALESGDASNDTFYTTTIQALA